MFLKPYVLNCFLYLSEHIFKGISFMALWIWEFLKTASQNWENPHNCKNYAHPEIIKGS